MHQKTICYMLVIYLRITGVVFASSCNRKYTNLPLNGYHCVHGHYVNITEISHPFCTHVCLRDRRCASLSFNMDTNLCQLSHEPCAVAEAETGFLLMNFRWDEIENCVTWETNGVGAFAPERLVNDYGAQHVTVGCIQIGEDIHVGVIENGNGFFVVAGTEHFENIDYKLMVVSPNCSVAWVAYRTGDPLPGGVIVAGHVTGFGSTYSIRVWRQDIGLMKYGVYATGEESAWYPYYGVVDVREVEILVQVWLAEDYTSCISSFLHRCYHIDVVVIEMYFCKLRILKNRIWN